MTDVWAHVDPADAALTAGLARLTALRRNTLDAGAVHAGWKVGFNGLDIRPALGITTGVVGFLTESTRATADRMPIPAAGAAVELEIAFELADTVTVEADDGTALDAIASIALAFEVVVLGDLDITDSLARDVWHHGYAVGTPVPWSGDLLPRCELAFRHGAEAVEVPAPGSTPLADVAAMLRFTASGAAAIGGTLGPGDVILSGSLAPSLVWVAPGDVVSVRSDLLGSLELELVAET